METKCIKTHAVKNNLDARRRPGSCSPTSRPGVKCNWGNPPKPFHIGRWRTLETGLPTYTSALGKFQRGSGTVFHQAVSAECWVWCSGPASYSPLQCGCTILALTFSLPDAGHRACRALPVGSCFLQNLLANPSLCFSFTILPIHPWYPSLK